MVNLPYGKRAIGTKYVYRNKKDERGIIVRNKVRLVAQGYTQEEGIDYDEVFALVSRIEAIRLFLAYASFLNFVVYQMDVKSAFLYGKIEEEVYVFQPLGFEDPEFFDRVYKVEKTLYDLHQDPRAWYETFSTYLLENRFQRGTIDKTLFIKKVKGDILIVQIYVDDIIFISTKKELCTEFEKLMHKKFRMSSMGELTFFLGLQVMQKEDGIFISQDKYMDEILKNFGFSTMRITSTPMETSKPLLKDAEAEDVDVHLYRSMIGSLMYLTSSRPDIMFAVCACARFQITPKVSHLHAVKRIFRYLKGQPKSDLWYPKDSPFDLEAYTDSDYAGASLDRKSTTRGCQFLRSRMISWRCKKQTVVANSTIEAEYVAAANCCGQVLWIQNQMLDYGYNFMNTKIFIDNESTICIVKKPVSHSKTKHIEIRHHFIKDSYEKRLIQVIKIHTDHNVADLPTKAFDVDLTFADSHNMVEYLEKPEDNADFAKIVDFLNASPIRTVTPLFATMLIQPQADMGEGSGQPTESQHTPTTASPSHVEPIPTGIGSGGSPRRQDTILGDRPAQTRFERLSKQSNDPPLSRVNTLGSGEDSMKLQELMDLCTKLSERVLALENIKTAQDLEITNLKKRVKKLEKKKKSRTPQLKRRLFKVRIESSAEKSLGDQEDASKQGRNEINQDEGISWFQEDAETQGRYGHDISTAEVTTASVPSDVDVSAASPIRLVDDSITDDITLAETLMKIKSSSSRSQKDKGVIKGQRREEEASNAALIKEWDSIEATIDADRQLAEQLQAQEREELTVEEQSKLLAELIETRRKYFAAKRAEENRNKPPTKTQ
ncbi:putative ribonuclease H-like domain-containing protein [Tanacetum coccineum]